MLAHSRCILRQSLHHTSKIALIASCILLTGHHLRSETAIPTSTTFASDLEETFAHQLYNEGRSSVCAYCCADCWCQCLGHHHCSQLLYHVDYGGCDELYDLLPGMSESFSLASCMSLTVISVPYHHRIQKRHIHRHHADVPDHHQ